MAVGFDAKMTGGNSADGFNQEASAATSISSTGITVGASATLLVVTAGWQNVGRSASPGSLAGTWDGLALTVAIQKNTTPNVESVAILYRINPAPGAKTLQLTWTNALDCYMGAVSFTGTDTSTGINAGDTTSSQTAADPTSIVINTTSDGATVAVMLTNGATPTVNQTKLWADAPFNPGGGSSYALGGSGTNTHSFTGAGGNDQALAGVHVIASGGGGGGHGPLLAFKRNALVV